MLTVAVASAIRLQVDYGESLRFWGQRFPNAGYEGWFLKGLFSSHPKPYNSFGNGSAMRVSAIGWASTELETVISEARRSAEVTHNHPEGIKGAQAVAVTVFLGRTGCTKEEIRSCLQDRFGYDCSTPLRKLRKWGGFDVTFRETVPAAAAAFLESGGVEDAIRNSVSLGGDADTLSCIAGAMAEAFHGGVPAGIQREVLGRLEPSLADEVRAFAARYKVPIIPDRTGAVPRPGGSSGTD